MGGAHRRHWASSLIAELASVSGRMLWCVESRRPLLFLPRLLTRRIQSLGPTRICRHYSKTVFHSLPTDYGSFVVWLPGTQPRQQETLLWLADRVGASLSGTTLDPVSSCSSSPASR